MPAAKKPKPNSHETHMSTKDIMERLGVSYRTAARDMAYFDAKGQTFHLGKIIRVPVSIFDEWYSQCFGKGKVSFNAGNGNY